MREEGIVPEEVKDEPKPKEYTKEEYEQYHKFVEDLNNLFAEIILRQMPMEESHPEGTDLIEGSQNDN